MDPNLSISGEGEFRGDLDAVRQLAASQWPPELARLKEMSLIIGAAVVYDMSMFDEEWSPLFHHSSDEPVGWVSGKTGERRDGSKHPNSSRPK